MRLGGATVAPASAFLAEVLLLLFLVWGRWGTSRGDNLAGDQFSEKPPKSLHMLTKRRVLRPVVVGVGLSILGTVFGHWFDLFLVSKKNTGGVPGSRIGPQSAPPPVGKFFWKTLLG